MIKTYQRSHPDAFTIMHSDPEVRAIGQSFMPGDTVTMLSSGGTGMIIAINDLEVSILWSSPPKMPFKGFVNAPYVPALKELAFGCELSDFKSRIKTQYGTKKVRADFYSTIYLLDDPRKESSK